MNWKKLKILIVLTIAITTIILNGCTIRKLTEKENRDFDRERERQERDKINPFPVLP